MGAEGSRLRVCGLGEGWGGLGGLGGLSGVYGGYDGEAARGEGSENMHGECGNDFVSRRARRWDYEGMRELVFRVLLGVNFSHGSRGTVQDSGRFQGGGEPKTAKHGGSGSLSFPRAPGGPTGHTKDRFWIDRRPSPDWFSPSLRYATDQLSTRLRIPSENSMRLPRGRLMAASHHQRRNR